MYIFTSSCIDLFIESFSKSVKIKKDFSWHYKYLVSSIYIQPYIDRRYNKFDYVPINFELIRKIISKQELSNILSCLLENNIIESDNTFIIGKKSKGYRIKDIEKRKWKLNKVSDKLLSKKIEKRMENLRENIQHKGNGYKIADYWFRKIDIDYKKAKKFIENNFRKDNEQYERGIININMMYNKIHFSTVDDKGNRLHTNLSVLPTPVRKFLTIDGSVLWQCDLANSQPVFLYTMLCKTSSIPESELIKYRDIVSAGKFYEFMADKANFKDLDLSKYDDRIKFKKTIFGGVLFDRNRKELSRWEKLFQSEFPNIFNYIRNFKKNNHNALAIALQKEESLFIYSTLEKIDNLIPNVILTTIHDCIVSDKKNISYIKKIMEKEFFARYNLIPSIKLELL